MNLSDLLLKKRKAPEKRQKRGCCGSTELPIVVAKRSWRQSSLWDTGIGPKRKRDAAIHLTKVENNELHPNPAREKLTKFRELCLKVVDTR